MTGGDGTGVDFAIGNGEGDRACGEHARVEHGLHVQGRGGGKRDGAGGSVGGQSFVESALQASHREGLAAGEGGDEVHHGAKPKHSADAICGGTG